MMDRRNFIATLASALAVAPCLRAQSQPDKVWRIGYLSLSSPTRESTRRWFAAFQDGLRTLGYVEGRNAILEQRYADGHVERLRGLAAELVDLKVDVLVAAPAGSARAAKEVTKSVPIVFMAEPDPVGTGLVASLARPEGNVTGLADAHADLIPKRLQLLKELVGANPRVGALFNPTNPSTSPQVKSAQAASRTLGLTLVPVAVKGPERGDVERAFAAIDKDRLDGLLVISDSTLGTHRSRIAELAIERRLPTSGAHRAWVEQGLLMAYGSDFVDLFRRGAALVDKLLQGRRPADLPIEQPTKFEFLINQRTARALGIEMPGSLLARADQVLR